MEILAANNFSFNYIHYEIISNFQFSLPHKKHLVATHKSKISSRMTQEKSNQRHVIDIAPRYRMCL